MTYTEPLLFVWLAIAFASWAAIRRNRHSSGTHWLLLSLVALTLTSWNPAAWLFSRPLEMWYPDQALDGHTAQAIVVPGSDYEDPTASRPFAMADVDMYGRCRLAAWVYHNRSSCPVLVSGHWATGVMRQILEAEGVPPEAIWEEKAARSTHENAAFSAKILRDHGISSIVLVEEARSMLRAEKCFEREGFLVLPAVSRRFVLVPDLKHSLPRWEPIAANEQTLHELVGLIWYRLRGWI